MVELAVGGMAQGAIYGLVAVGVVLIFRTTGIVNFAHGEFLMVGAYTYLSLNFAGLVGNSALDAVLQLLAVVVVGAALGLLFFFVSHILLRRAELLHIIIATFALSVVLINAARLVFSPSPYRVPGWLLGDARVQVGQGAIAVNSIIVLLVTLASAIALFWWFRRTDAGKAVRAVAENREYSELSGIPVRRMLALSWVAGGTFTAVAGLLLAPAVGVYPSIGQDVLFKGFVAATLGGFDSVIGAIVGGVFLGVVEVVAVVAVGGDWRDVVSFAALLIVLLLRPTGLFGAAQIRRA